MGSFKLVELDELSYNTPQEMYADRKNRSIQSLFDHQWKMNGMDLYMRGIRDARCVPRIAAGKWKNLRRSVNR